MICAILLVSRTITQLQPAPQLPLRRPFNWRRLRRKRSLCDLIARPSLQWLQTLSPACRLICMYDVRSDARVCVCGPNFSLRQTRRRHVGGTSVSAVVVCVFVPVSPATRQPRLLRGRKMRLPCSRAYTRPRHIAQQPLANNVRNTNTKGKRRSPSPRSAKGRANLYIRLNITCTIE